MSIPSYPATLPYRPKLDGFARPEHHRDLVVSQVEDGPDIMRVQSQARIKKISYVLIFTDAEYAIWENFVEATLGQGSSHFTMSVPVVGRTYQTRRVYIEGGKWSDEPVGRDWRVRFTLCVFPGT